MEKLDVIIEVQVKRAIAHEKEQQRLAVNAKQRQRYAKNKARVRACNDRWKTDNRSKYLASQKKYNQQRPKKRRS